MYPFVSSPFDKANSAAVLQCQDEWRKALSKADWKHVVEYAGGFIQRLALVWMSAASIEKRATEPDAWVREVARWSESEARSLLEFLNGCPSVLDEWDGPTPQDEAEVHRCQREVLRFAIHALLLLKQTHAPPSNPSIGTWAAILLHEEHKDVWVTQLTNRKELVAAALLVAADGAEAAEHWLVMAAVAPHGSDASHLSLGHFMLGRHSATQAWEWVVASLKNVLPAMNKGFAAGYMEAMSAAPNLDEATRKLVTEHSELSVARIHEAPPPDLSDWMADDEVGFSWYVSVPKDRLRTAVIRTLEMMSGIASLAGAAESPYARSRVRLAAAEIVSWGAADANGRTLLEVDTGAMNASIPVDGLALWAALSGRSEHAFVWLHRLGRELASYEHDGTLAAGRFKRSLHFWSRAEAQFTEPSFHDAWKNADCLMGYCTVLEVALGSSDKSGVVNALATRAAAILASDPTHRLAESARVKKLYDLRSQYVHAGAPMSRRPDVEETRKVARTVLLDLCRWLGSGNSERSHAEYLRWCDERAFGRTGSPQGE
jgi:hypothetical protein